MTGIRIISGYLKGRIIPFANRQFGNADITQQKLKGALFSHIGEDLHDKSFLDMYACSGQIGIEALSRGAQCVVINEKEKKRFRFIENYIASLPLASSPLLLNLTDSRAARHLSELSYIFEYIYLDPPYQTHLKTNPVYHHALRLIHKNGLLKKDGRIFIQHFSKNPLPNTLNTFIKKWEHPYGNSSLAEYGYEE